jgi:hypothetical protein
MTETNGNMWRLFEQEVWVPNGSDGDENGNFQNSIKYDGYMPNGDEIKYGITFLDIRSKYLTQEDKGTYDNGYVKKFQEAYNEAVANGTDKSEAMETVELNYHRFWHAGDILIALGTMYELYPDMEVDRYDDVDEDELVVTPSKVTLAVGDSQTLTATINGDEVVIDSVTSDSTAVTVDGSTITAAAESTSPVTVTVTAGGMTATVTVTVTAADTTDASKTHWGDVDCNDLVEIADVVTLNMYLLDKEATPVSAQGLLNADCEYDKTVDMADAAKIINYLAELIPYSDLGDQ